MIKISGKEFRLNFGKYKDVLEEVVITGRRGEVVGSYRSARIGEDKVKTERGEDREVGSVLERGVCERCRCGEVDGEYKEYNWESGEEWGHRLCKKCSHGMTKE